ncbi:Uu.00g105570.m01.CDS01 [Anthostomella pinea]|uniref:Uu.00g105570.m01.CDS01 n=1 Tax=Anthostomella pinea TaxID=933095 RepID=A0AAI8YFQ3_9PEZI|nr:Uu.00g105570.m01.CDS01 [Anthostomella pinea]
MDLPSTSSQLQCLAGSTPSQYRQQKQRFPQRQPAQHPLRPPPTNDNTNTITNNHLLQQQQQQQIQLMNGGGAMQANGAGPAPGAMQIGPAPAGHQAELNIIYGMVEELSRQLSENRRVTEDIVSGLGRVRNRARERGLGNDDVLGEAADELFAQEPNLEAMLSILSESLDRAKLSRDANFSLIASYAKVFESIIMQFHAYKQKHIADVSAWHRSYRSQLAEARAENSRLREQMWDVQEHASHANQTLREFRKKYDENEARWQKRVDEKARKQELRFWKRMAMPELADTEEGYWSDDDDLVDPVEKERLKEVERKVAEQALAGVGSASSQQSEDSEGDGVEPHSLSGIVGGVAMERDGSSMSVMPVPPPRPATDGAASTRRWRPGKLRVPQ